MKLVSAALGVTAVFVLVSRAMTGATLEHALSSARAAATEPGSFECRWTDTPVKIDGEAESVWAAARRIDRPALDRAGRGARDALRVRFLWDRESLYFLAEVTEAAAAEGKDAGRPTPTRAAFRVLLEPGDDKGGYELEVDAVGAIAGRFVARRPGGGVELEHRELALTAQGAWSGALDGARRRRVEARIPWRDFVRGRGRPEAGERWKVFLEHGSQDYALLRFSGPDPRAARPFGIERRLPLTTSRVIGSPDPPLPYRARRVYPKLALTYPVTVVAEPGSDRMLAIVQDEPGGASRILRFRDQSDVDSAETLLMLDRTAYDLLFEPRFAATGHFYVSSKGPLSAERPGRKMQVARFTMARQAPFGIDAASEKVIIDWPSDGHDGGGMVFGRDGMLYITSGDGTSDSDTNVAGQDMTRLLAKLLRIDVDHPAAGQAYSVPADNPFVGMNDVRPETWAFGFRNPWRMTVDRETGHIWVGNGGQDLWETAHLVERGANYGWSAYEGSHPFYPKRALGPAPLARPTLEHPHSESRSLTGGLVYYGRRFPELRGAYIYGDYSTGKIWAARHDGTRLLSHREIADTQLQIVCFGADTQGELVIVDIGSQPKTGGFYTLEATPGAELNARTAFPIRLTESGLFRSVRGHVAQAGLIPYTVNAPLWSDGAYKERYIALPGDDSKIDVTASGGWNFPDGAVLVKSFALDLEEGNPKSRRWVETRFLSKQQGEWVGYSYRWNSGQTDAELVGASGEDLEIAIRVARSAEHPEGIRKQIWRYPGRAECMACHSRAANYVLGLTTLQMNREQGYGRRRDNQLRVLEHLGLVRIDWTQQIEEGVRAAARARGLTGAKIDDFVREQTGTSGPRPTRTSHMLGLSPENTPRLVDPSDGAQSLERRARSYLHANCAHCHVGAGGGNAAMQLEFMTTPENTRMLDVRPLHDEYGLPEARLIARGSPERSVLLHRMSHRNRGAMPPLATSAVDRDAVALMREWIAQMRADRPREADNR